MNGPQTLLLLGLRGSGKSTIARTLADNRGVRALDLDPLVLDRMGYSDVKSAWDDAGEHAFRTAERDELQHQLAAVHEPTVIALGGGTPTAPGAVDLIQLKRDMRVVRTVYLHLEPVELVSRIESRDPDRPPLTDAKGPLEEMQHVYTDRDGIYRAISDRTIEAGGTTVEWLEEEVWRAWAG